MSPRGAALFDVDGTLVDSTYLHAVTWWEAFRQAGHRVPMADIHRTIGMGSDHLLDHLLSGDRDRDQDEAIRTAHGTLFAQYWERLAPLDGAADLLRACAKRGWTVVLASSAHGPELAAMRRALDAEDAITAVTGSDDVSASKPAPDLVKSALEHSGVNADEAVFIGDTVWDVRASHRAGVPCLAVLSGGYPEHDLREAGAYEVYDGPADLAERLDSSLLAAPGER
ncbi:HAD family hydrolase [Streptomyces griseoflavus]|uniref:HAD family hydrolase n=1 Tax=Streptomyces TaxID=1883 RepID=UPI0004C842E3|nr:MULTISPECIES: HAD family hydrolase [Streptomyces]KOG53379.1 HAD family hydrolase [Streptomyces griseoflavus]KWT60169.1 HAD family hydrolase [Streptomyces albus subsp. albus]